jgi:TPP-dependent trihydroxycyclohexane-1,2-dione (THcHDO) dehydratase
MKTTQDTINDLIDLLQSREEYINAQAIIKIIPEIKNDTNLREIINTLRKANKPIVSSSNGYKWSNDDQEILACAEQLYSRASGIKAAADGLKTIILEKNFWES